MPNPIHPPVLDPQELERLLIVRQHAGDVDGMVALFEPDAVIDCGGGQFVRGHAAIRAFYAEIVAAGRKFGKGEQRPALICGDLALTSTRLPPTRLTDGDITSEVARRQADGSWLWVIDRYSVNW
jgi:ketosteroid isomerase-like protein